MPLFRDTGEFGPTLDAAAEQLGISTTAIEKDYWVSEVLRVLAHDFEGDFIFKGGTSLSKGYHIVERFSEDIDVLVLPGERGRNATDTLMKAMGAAAAAGIGGVASSVGGSETGRHRSYEVVYPATRKATRLIRTGVLLEMGVRGGPHPHESVPITCLLGDVLDAEGTDLTEFTDLVPFTVLVLHPARTLLEKLVHIHAAAQALVSDPAWQPDARSGRHCYDVFQLLGDDRVLNLLGEREQVQQILESIDEITRDYFGGGDETELRLSGGFATSPAFDTGTDVSLRLRDAYETTMPKLYFGTGPLPTWDAVCGRVADRSALV
ncbi:MAG TPA: nucleotidyl transferase AbiEii/AbiGii toxin family protein [Nocardioidaceae bacterium]|nr:nucleotidyl transferase AbiEii/AbiGii toxin family protein [Nocardioidaceae bacterium]